MKHSFLTALLLFLGTCAFTESIGIGTNTPHPSASLDITDSTKGILIPRMTFSQRSAIQNPSEGLMVYQTDNTKGFWHFDGTVWKQLNISLNIVELSTAVKRLQTQDYIKQEIVYKHE